MKFETVFLKNFALGIDVPVGIVVEIGEEAVGVRVGVDLGDIDAVAAGEQRHVDAGTADDDGIVAAESGSLIKRVGDLRAGNVKVAVGEDDVAAILEGAAAGEGVEGLVAENDGLADGERAETLVIVGNEEQQRAVAADAPAFGNADQL